MTSKCPNCSHAYADDCGCTDDVREFDPSKQVKTRDGRDAEIVYTGLNAMTGESIVAIVKEINGFEEPRLYHKNGRWLKLEDHLFDLVNVPETVKVCVIVESAEAGKDGIRIRTIRSGGVKVPDEIGSKEVGRAEVEIVINR